MHESDIFNNHIFIDIISAQPRYLINYIVANKTILPPGTPEISIVGLVSICLLFVDTYIHAYIHAYIHMYVTYVLK